MVLGDAAETRHYKVVINHEEQYSIWPQGRENPAGWTDEGKSGPKDDCLAYVGEVWTDIRPRSLRGQLGAMGGAHES